MTVKEFLGEPARIQTDIFKLESRIYELRSLAAKCTAMLSPVPGGSHDDRSLEEKLIRIADLEQEKQALILQKDQAVLSLLAMLQPLEAESIRLLSQRYLELIPPDSIMKAMSWSRRTYYRYMSKALGEFEAIYLSQK